MLPAAQSEQPLVCEQELPASLPPVPSVVEDEVSGRQPKMAFELKSEMLTDGWICRPGTPISFVATR